MTINGLFVIQYYTSLLLPLFVSLGRLFFLHFLNMLWYSYEFHTLFLVVASATIDHWHDLDWVFCIKTLEHSDQNDWQEKLLVLVAISMTFKMYFCLHTAGCM